MRVWKPFSRPQARSGEDDERLAKAGTPDGEAGTPESLIFLNVKWFERGKICPKRVLGLYWKYLAFLMHENF